MKRLAHRLVSRNYVQSTLKHLMSKGYITRLYRGSYKTRKASIYRLTNKYQQVLRSSDKYYHSLADMHNRKGAFADESQRIRSSQPRLQPHSVDHHSSWRGLLPQSQETDQFLAALKGLENYPISFRRLEAIREASGLKSLHLTQPLIAGSISIAYRPTATGRLQSVPHTYIGKELSLFLRPAEDPDLEHGCLFSLDYSQQELRLLTSYSKDTLLQRYANDRHNMFDQIMDELPRGKKLNKCGKVAIYSFVYGSNGWALKEAFDKEYGFDRQHLEEAHNFGIELRRLFPGVAQFQQELEQGLTENKTIVAPGGVCRDAELVTKAITKRGTVSKRWARRTALSHVIQGSGAWITRKVVTAAAYLKESRLFMPVHDGFIFYSCSKDPNRAIIEAATLLENCANEAAPDVIFPVKLEWSIGRNARDI